MQQQSAAAAAAADHGFGDTAVDARRSLLTNNMNPSLAEQQQQQMRQHGLTYHNLCYSIKQRRGPPCCSPAQTLKILNDVCGTLPPGMNAIMGPTGSGKTTLLDAIAGRKDPKCMSGTVLVDGRPQPKNFKCASGYVAQEDSLMGTLTVRENLLFSAALRLPASVTDKERRRRVDGLLEQLGLSLAADRRIGTQLLRGVSGGEKKRTSIGMEIIFDPEVLFLDEPTTGLDASTAYSVMELLQQLARTGKIIIFSIHQPRYSIFRTFDTLTILSRGETVYQGQAGQSLPYFESLGYRCEEFNNPLDLFLDVVNGDQLPSDDADTSQWLKLKDNNNKGKPDMHDSLVKAFQQSPIGHEANKKTEQVLHDYNDMLSHSPQLVKAPPAAAYRRSLGHQLVVLAGRSVKNIIRNPQTSIAQLGVNIVFSVVVGLIFLRIPADLQSGVQNRVGVFFFVTMSMVFGNMNAIELFLDERPLFAHENMSGYYRVSAYFIAKVFCDLLPLRVVPLMIYAPISYFMIGLDPKIDKFAIYCLTLLSVSLGGAGMAFFVSATASVFSIASLMLAMTNVFMMVFAGLLVNLSTMGDWLNWLRYVSAFRYSLNALSVNELKDMKFCNATSDFCVLAGNQYLEAQGIPYKESFDLWFNIIALAGFIVVFMALAYVQLRRLFKYK